MAAATPSSMAQQHSDISNHATNQPQDGVTTAVLLPLKQAVFAGLLSSLAAFVLVSLGFWLFTHPSLLIDEEDKASETAMMAWRTSGGLVLSQGVAAITSLVPLLHEAFCVTKVSRTSLHCLRVSSLQCSLAGLVLVLCCCTGYSHGDDSNHKWLVGVTAGFVMVAASGALMVSFFPPLLQSEQRERPRRPRHHSEENPTHGQHDYQLLQDDEEQDVSEDIDGGGGDDNEEQEEEDGSSSQDSASETSSETSQESSSPARWRGTRRLLQMAAPQVTYLYAGCAVLLLRLPFSLAMPHLVSTTLVAVGAGDFAEAHQQVLLLLTAGTIDAALDFWCVFLFGMANQRIVRSVRLDLFHTLLRQEVAFYDQTSSGVLASRLSSDCTEMASDLTWFFRFSIESVVRISGISGYMLYRSPLLGAAALSIVPVVACVNKVYGDWLSKNATKVQDALAEANQVAHEVFANMRTVLAFGAEDWEQGRYHSSIQRHYVLNIRQLFWTGIYYMAISTFLINTLVQAALLYLGSRLVQDERLTADVLLAFMLYQSQLQNETLNLFQSYSSLIKSSGAGDKVFGILDREPPPPATASRAVQEQYDPHRTSTQNPPVEVQFRNVQFCYASRPEQQVLNGLTWTIPAGSTVALVGASGCGKSTVMHLLQRFYDVQSGNIFINGIDIRDMDLAQHRSRIAVVSQEAALFLGTLTENIRYGCPENTTQEQIEAASVAAAADDFIRSFPNGYDTMVGERGMQLSGGQKQRIAIARAMVRKAGLLLLDEATASLDGASEEAVQQALDRLCSVSGTTVLIVAHRLRTVRQADCIAVLHEGQIVEQGTHDQLMGISAGRYRHMVERASSSGLLDETTSAAPAGRTSQGARRYVQ